jgi:hypothetical protein
MGVRPFVKCCCSLLALRCPRASTSTGIAIKSSLNDTPSEPIAVATLRGRGCDYSWPELRCGIDDQPLTGAVQVRATFEEFIVGDAQIE